MKRTLILIGILFNFLISYGQKQHLEPTNFNVGGNLETYYKNLNELLFKDLADNPFARFMAIPSFSKEYGFAIEKKKNKYFINSITLSESYWRAKNRNEVKVIREKNEIEQELYNQIGRLFQLLAKQTEKYDTIYYKSDGETYYFITTDNNGEICIGETWSPSENSMTGKLIKNAIKIYSIGNGNSSLKTEVKNEIDELLTELTK
jgi:hypothetical protein